MTVNYFIKCPVCERITRMRTPAGYVYSTPVRVHCMNCQTLLCGEFISDNEKIRAYYKPSNCDESKENRFDYYGEASGEMLCSKITAISGTIDNNIMPRISPVFSFMESISEEDRCNYIDYACYIDTLNQNRDISRIKYELYMNEKFDLIQNKYYKEALKAGYCLSDQFSVTRYIYYSMLFDCGGMFRKKEIKKILKDINYHFYHMDRKVLRSFLQVYNDDLRLKKAEEKILGILLSFVDISKYILPVIGFSLYDNAEVDLKIYGLSTCTFSDISKFFQDSFETLVEYCDIVACLDNVEIRGDYNSFANSYSISTFREQRKGNRLHYLTDTKASFFSHTIDIPDNSGEIRNAIGHNDYSYNGITQEIHYTAKGVSKSEYLVSIALECLSIAKSAYLMAFIIYELKRYHELILGNSAELNPIFYKGAHSQNHCPCGSQKKYRDCCKKKVEAKRVTLDKYPSKSSCSFEIPNGITSIGLKHLENIPF